MHYGAALRSLDPKTIALLSNELRLPIDGFGTRSKRHAYRSCAPFARSVTSFAGAFRYHGTPAHPLGLVSASRHTHLKRHHRDHLASNLLTKTR